MTAVNKQSNSQAFMTSLVEVVSNTFKSMSKTEFTKDPQSRIYDIIEYNSRMRVFALEKFQGPCLVVALYFYLTPQDKEEHKCYGNLILYIEEGSAERMLKALGYKNIKEDQEQLLLDRCGDFGQAIATNLKQELMKRGLPDFVIAPPEKYKNDVPDGVEFPYSQYQAVEASFFLWKKKALVVELTLASM